MDSRGMFIGNYFPDDRQAYQHGNPADVNAVQVVRHPEQDATQGRCMGTGHPVPPQVDAHFAADGALHPNLQTCPRLAHFAGQYARKKCVGLGCDGMILLLGYGAWGNTKNTGVESVKALGLLKEILNVGNSEMSGRTNATCDVAGFPGYTRIRNTPGYAVGNDH